TQFTQCTLCRVSTSAHRKIPHRKTGICTCRNRALTLRIRNIANRKSVLVQPCGSCCCSLADMRFVLETERLKLRPLRLTDVDEFHRLCIGENFRKYLFDDEAIPFELAASFITTSNRYFDTSGYGLWAVRQRDEEPLIGYCGFWFFHEPPELELL